MNEMSGSHYCPHCGNMIKDWDSHGPILPRHNATNKIEVKQDPEVMKAIANYKWGLEEKKEDDLV
jgi:hypothetical protein